jgi:hypothetical protein
MYPPPSYELGRPLNLPDGDDLPDDATGNRTSKSDI